MPGLCYYKLFVILLTYQNSCYSKHILYGRLDCYNQDLLNIFIVYFFRDSIRIQLTSDFNYSKIDVLSQILTLETIRSFTCHTTHHRQNYNHFGPINSDE